ncbi:hypothetical protein AB2L27_20025 [Kineococcus sp. LSe6-4]|uniref:Sensor histidine kinase n=1 Tax=Kineococcus halophytocola TaxID=3234027 RepID=A0ABV4H8B7_9ACTN
MLVALFALVMSGVVVGTIRLAEVVVDRTIRRALAPLHAQLAEYRQHRLDA